jgi:hypothetical protein
VKERYDAVAAELIYHTSGFLELRTEDRRLIFNLEEVLKACRRGDSVSRNRAAAAYNVAFLPLHRGDEV